MAGTFLVEAWEDLGVRTKRDLPEGVRAGATGVTTGELCLTLQVAKDRPLEAVVRCQTRFDDGRLVMVDPSHLIFVMKVRR